MRQTRIGSLVEALINVLIGYSVSVASTQFIFPAYGYQVTLRDNLVIGVWFTFISIARSYVVRRYFEARLRRMAAHLNGEQHRGM